MARRVEVGPTGPSFDKPPGDDQKDDWQNAMHLTVERLAADLDERDAQIAALTARIKALEDA